MSMEKKFKKWMIALVAGFVAVLLFVGFWLVPYLVNSTEKSNPTHLYLYGDMADMNSKKDVRSVTAKFTQGKKEVNCYATIKIQGTSSLGYEKKNYTINFYDDPSHTQKSNIDLGWGAANEYCLKANRPTAEMW